MEQDIYPDVCSVRVRATDSFLLCTDGLWNVLSEKRIVGLLLDGAEPAGTSAALIAAAKAAGSCDDITCVVVGLAPAAGAKL
jgi:serine/threonine protein phosphatase PrpC